MKKHELYKKLWFSDRPLIDDVFDIVYQRLERRVPKKTFKSIPQENMNSVDAIVRSQISRPNIKRIRSGVVTIKILDAVLKGLQ